MSKGYPIDVTDIVNIRINRSQLYEFIVDSGGILRELDDNKTRIKTLNGLIENINELLLLATKVSDIRKTIIEGSKMQDKQKIDEDYDKAIDEYRRTAKKIKSDLLNYIASSKDLTREDAEKEYSAMIKKDPSKKGLAVFLKSEIDTLSAESSKVIKNAVEQSPLRLRLSAILYRKSKGGIPIHLEGYDDGKPGEYQFRDKLSFVQSEERQEKIKESLKVANELKTNIDKSIANKESLFKILYESYNILRKAGLDIPDPNAIKEMVDDIAEKANSLNKSIPAESKSEFETFQSTIHKITDNVQSYKSVAKLLEIFRSPPKSASDTELLMSINSEINDLIPNIQNDVITLGSL